MPKLFHMKFIDFYLTTENNYLEYLANKKKKVIFLESEDVNHIKSKLSNSFKLEI